MTTTETCHYRGYDIVPTRLWSSWCVGIYRTRADLPLMAQSTLSTFAPLMEEAVGEAKQSIDRILSPSTIGALSKGTQARMRVASQKVRRAEIPDVPPSCSRTTDCLGILRSPGSCGADHKNFTPDVFGRFVLLRCPLGLRGSLGRDAGLFATAAVSW